MRYTTINGVDFETTRTKYAGPAIERHYNPWSYDDITEAYDNPSNAKRAIYADWREWADITECVRNMRITSKNTFAFTLGALYVDGETGEVLGYISITRDHNRLMISK